MEGDQEATALVRAGTVMSLAPRNMDEALAFCESLSKSDLVPKEFRMKPANIMLAVQMGAELGLQPMQAIQSIAVINGRPSIWGDGLLGLVRASGLLEEIDETYDETKRTATCSVKRKGDKKPVVRSFSWAEAEKIVQTQWVDGQKRSFRLCDKDTYKSYPARMLQMRARTFALRDAFADVLRGLTSREEAQDIESIEVDAAGQTTVVVEPASDVMPRRVGESATPAAAASVVDGTVIGQTDHAKEAAEIAFEDELEAAKATGDAVAIAKAALRSRGLDPNIVDGIAPAAVAEPVKRGRPAPAAPEPPAATPVPAPGPVNDGSSAEWGPYLGSAKHRTPGEEEFVGAVTAVQQPSTAGPGRSVVVCGPKKFGTFSKSIASAAILLIGTGQEVRITFDEGEYGRELRTLQVRPGQTVGATAAPASTPAPEAPAAAATVVLISQAQKTELVALFNRKGLKPAAVKAYLVERLKVEKTADLPAEYFESVKGWAEAQ